MGIETKVEKYDIFYKITIIDGKKFTFMLGRQEFNKLCSQIRKIKKEEEKEYI